MSLTASLSTVADTRVPLHCNVCGHHVATVHAPAPPVPVRCSACKAAR
jgi:hypothetical protein